MEAQFQYGVDRLTSAKALAIVRGELRGVLSDTQIEKIETSRDCVDQIIEESIAVYGINTGFGPLCNTMISKEDTSILQHNILKSHSVGVGHQIPQHIAKLMLVLKLHALAQAYSGIALSTLQRIQWHIDNDVIPIVPEKGSVGASGDLAPLAHLFLPLIGLGKVNYKGEILDTAFVFQKESISALALGGKEGLALINGTQFIAAFAVCVIEKMHNCLSHADLIGALMIEGLLASPAPFSSKLHQLRPYPGNIHVAARIRSLLQDSEIVESHENCDRVQDPYSLRCIPQVHGTSRTAWLHLKEIVEIELNAVTDNPVIFSAEETISGGNFHGQPLAMPLDYACIAASELGSISDRRTYLSLMGHVDGVPKLLMKNTGINSGFMMLQYTTAALASENKGLCFPASADSIPTSLGQEDHVSMGSIGGRKAFTVCQNVEKILAIEMICAAQAFDYHRPLKSSHILERVHAHIRTIIPHTKSDRVFGNDIENAINLIESRAILSIANDDILQTEFESLFESY